jgi:hypothetical protein
VSYPALEAGKMISLQPFSLCFDGGAFALPYLNLESHYGTSLRSFIFLELKAKVFSHPA